MNFRYPHLTAGYLGIRAEKSTLNSLFYCEFFNNNKYINDSIIFPQRVPRKEFFVEMLQLEEPSTTKLLDQFRINLKKQTFQSLHVMLTQNQDVRSFLNNLNLLLRYGLSDVISTIDSKNFSALMQPSDFAEFELLKQISIFQLSNDNTNTSNLIYLANKALFQSDLSNRIQISILNYLIVSAYRFNIKLPYKECLKECSEKLLTLIELDSMNDFGSLIRKSIAYRGLAMVKEYGHSLQNDFLNKAEQLARNIKPTEILEKITAKENLYTCLQTLSKWNTSLNQLTQAKSNLSEMISLDPFDSTGYGEMAFFLINQDNYEEAAHHYNFASELGSPAIGMHTYYYGKCLQILGKTDNAIDAFYKSIKLDPEAVSPWLDLFDYYLETNNSTKTKEIASHLLQNSIYRNQLEEGEVDKMKESLIVS